MSLLFLLLLTGCGSGGKESGATGLNSQDCGDVCPEGTRKASFDAVVRGTGQAIIGEDCETICETIVPCSPPNVPTITESAYVCAPLEGFVDFPADSEVDFSWADGWVQP